jgi:hypothetical protein
LGKRNDAASLDRIYRHLKLLTHAPAAAATQTPTAQSTRTTVHLWALEGPFKRAGLPPAVLILTDHQEQRNKQYHQHVSTVASFASSMRLME